jgi:hypothetical protein
LALLSFCPKSWEHKLIVHGRLKVWWNFAFVLLFAGIRCSEADSEDAVDVELIDPNRWHSWRFHVGHIHCGDK